MKRFLSFCFAALLGLIVMAQSYDFSVPFMECGYLFFKYDYSESDAVKLTSCSIVLVDNDSCMADFAILPDIVTYNGHDYRVTSIGESAFSNVQVRNLIIGDFVEVIDSIAFKGNIYINHITFGENVKRIYRRAFADCVKLKSITFNDNLTNIDSGLFSGCTSLTSLELPESLIFTSTGMCDGCTALETVKLGSKVFCIEPYAFRNCSSLKSITLPPVLTEIAYNSFESCTCLESINIPEGVVRMTGGCFKNCISLFEITIPNSISSAFYQEMFMECENLVIVTLGSRLEQVQARTFFGYNSLRRIICRNPNVTEVKNLYNVTGSAFDNFDCSKCILEVPFGTSQAYIDAGWTGFKTVVETPSTFDVDQDGYVNISDVTKLIDYLLCR